MLYQQTFTPSTPNLTHWQNINYNRVKIHNIDIYYR